MNTFNSTNDNHREEVGHVFYLENVAHLQFDCEGT